MKIIVLVAVLGVLLAGIFGPQDAVGGSLLMGLIILLAMAAIGIHEAWSNRRGPLGWIVNIPAAIIGGLVASQIADILFVLIFVIVPFEGSLAASSSPLKFVMLIAMPVVMLVGSWGTLWLINRWRDRGRGVGAVARG